MMFSQSCLSFFFYRRKFRSCISSSFFCHKRGKVLNTNIVLMEIFLIVQLTAVSFIAGLTSLCVLRSCCTALSLCSPWALPKPEHKPFPAELSMCATGDSLWQKAQMPQAPEFWLPRGTPGTEEDRQKHHIWNFRVLSV